MKSNKKSDDIDNSIDNIVNSRKYRSIGIPKDTILDIYSKELTRLANPKQALDSTREKLHNITALYLGDPDYDDTAKLLNTVSGDENQLKVICQQVLQSHISTRERLPILTEFYEQIFKLTGKPNSILDLACGLNPFAFPWMGLPKTVQYYAYDLNLRRIELINQFFKAYGLKPLGTHTDILVNPPRIQADVAFLFKEAHRMEQRQKGCSLPFWRALNVKWLLVSLPTASMSGKHSLIEKHRKLVANIFADVDWPMTEIIFSNEIVFCIQKG
jgi:16S rRNA (guanine(1405)-N(7))-methyltransferase